MIIPFENKNIQPPNKSEVVHIRSNTYVLDGNPIPLKRPRFGNHKCWDAQKQEKMNYRFILAEQHNLKPKFSGPLKLDVTFYFAIPKSISKKKKQQLLSTYHTIKPDIDNLIKFILDIGNDILYDDDCTFAEICAKKIYDSIGQTSFTISELNG